jgi:hypothetical protein
METCLKDNFYQWGYKCVWKCFLFALGFLFWFCATQFNFILKIWRRITCSWIVRNKQPPVRQPNCHVWNEHIEVTVISWELKRYFLEILLLLLSIQMTNYETYWLNQTWGGVLHNVNLTTKAFSHLVKWAPQSTTIKWLL